MCHRCKTVSMAMLIVAFTATEASATNGECEEIRMLLNPIYQQLIAALDRHLYARDINLKIDAETDTWALMQFRDMADRHDKQIVNLIREYNDNDPVAARKCSEVVFKADCEAYLVYQDAVINLPGINRENVLAEGRLRCERVYRY